MITENRLTAYINSLDQGDGELIEQIAETAVKNRVPIIRRETATLLKTMDACFPCQDPGSRNSGGVFSAFDGVCNAGKLPDHDNRKI